MDIKNQVTFGHLLTIVSIIILPILYYGAVVDRHMEQSKSMMKDLIKLQQEVKILRADDKEYQNKTNLDYMNIIEKLHNIELKLK